jgi:hypothetical protein
MSPLASSSRRWQLPAVALIAGAILLALRSGDPLLILGVLCGAAGLLLLARPAPVRPAAVLALPRRSARRRTLTGADATAMLRRHGSHTIARRGHRTSPAAPPTRVATSRASLLVAQR